MPESPPDFKELGYYFSLAQVGLEMVTPLGMGAVLDYWLDSAPWATVVGAVFGFTGGLVHLIVLANRNNSGSSKPKGDSA